jgi:2-C-methyl-D-erythritol 4-phosphate cytidylyltransferase
MLLILMSIVFPLLVIAFIHDWVLVHDAARIVFPLLVIALILWQRRRQRMGGGMAAPSANRHEKD